MKPQYLAIEGINSFLERQEINFSVVGHDNIFCICGETGSGKTTIFDSIILAIYGEGERGNIPDYINLDREFGKVEFHFLYDGSVYHINRTFYRKLTRANSARLERIESSGAVILLASTVDETNAKLLELIGLKRKEFTQVVLLEQGKFNKFLLSTRTDRHKTVGQIFNLDKYGERLSRKVSDKFAAVKLEFVRSAATLATYDNVTSELLNVLNNSAITARAECVELEKVYEIAQIAYEENSAKKKIKLEIDRQQQRKVASESQLQQLIKDLQECESVLASIKQGNQKDVLSAQIADSKLLIGKLEPLISVQKSIIETDKSIIELRADYKTAQGKLVELNSAIAANEQNIERLSGGDKDFAKGKDKLIVEDSTLAAAEKTKADLEDTIRKLEKELENYCAQHIATSSKLRRDQEILDQAKLDLKSLIARLEVEKSNNSLAILLESLSAGDSCPICSNIIEHKATAESVDISPLIRMIETKEIELARQDAAIKNLLQLESTHLAKASATREQISTARASLGEIIAKLSASNHDEIRAKLSSIKQLEAIEENQNTLKFAKQKEEAALDKVLERGNTLKLLRDNEFKQITSVVASGDVEGELAAQRTRLIELTAQLSAFESKVKSLEEIRARAKEDTSKFEAVIAGCNQYLANNGTQLSEDEFEKSAADKASAYSQLEQAKKKLVEIEQNLRDTTARNLERVELIKSFKLIEKEHDLLDKLSKMLKGQAFLEFIAEEYIMEFTSEASKTLNKLSGGKYTLSYDENFYVLDFAHNNERRKIATLSGGETFLASLSISMAISASIAREKNYNFFFLDEGFGTLHSSAIDTVVDALYNLSSETLVGVISHRVEIVDRIANKLVVTGSRGEGEGSVITTIS